LLNAIDAAMQEHFEHGDPHAPLVARGIRPDVIDERGYVPFYGKYHRDYDAASRDAWIDAWRPPGVSDESWERTRADYRRKTDQTPATMRLPDGSLLQVDWKDEGEWRSARFKRHGQGLFVVKRSFPEAERFGPILPQLRPEVPFVKPDKCHWHDAAVIHDRLRDIKTPRKHSSPEAARAHVARVKARFPGARIFARGSMSYFVRRKLVPVCGAYDLSKLDGIERYKAHIRDEHEGASDELLETLLGAEHEQEDGAKYTLPLGRGKSRRLDVHPFAYKRMRDAEVVVYAIEGSVKGDAVLSRILDEEEAGRPRPWSVFCTPSVTTAHAKELRHVSRTVLRNKLVVVCCDADWVSNEAVRRAALDIRDRYLEDEGVRAAVAAPPLPEVDDPQPCSCRRPIRPEVDEAGVACRYCGGYFKGVDDFLVAGGSLDNLSVLDRRGSYRLALHADRDGMVYGSVRSLASLLEVGKGEPRYVIERLAELEAAGRVEIVRGDLEPHWVPNKWHKKTSVPGDEHGRWRYKSFALRIPARYRIDDDFAPLGQYLERYRAKRERLLSAAERRAEQRAAGRGELAAEVRQHMLSNWVKDAVLTGDARWLDEAKTQVELSTPSAPTPAHLDAAIKKVAAVHGLERDTLADYPEVAALRGEIAAMRGQQIHAMSDFGGLSQQAIGREVGPISDRTVRTVLAEEPGPLPEWIELDDGQT
jgi:hypothetical protein